MEKILNDLKFQKKLTQLADQTRESYEEVYQAAKGYLKELYTVHTPLANVAAVQGAQYILSRGYNKTIDVNPQEIKNIAKLSRKHSIAFVMTHKTYIDMFVLGVTLARHGLPIPYTFAGINMSFMGLGQFGRQSGAIFIRRSFKDNPVYKATLRAFIASLVDQKADFMWAIEGTRSRTGKLVWPKMGILKYIKEAEQDSKEAVKYIPVSIVYDLIPDVKEMTQEGRGKAKKAESLAWFMNYIKKMGDNFGKISLRFGDPVEIEEEQSIALKPGKADNASYPSAAGAIPRFALELVYGINKITPVTTTSLICIALLSKYSLSKRGIESDLADLMQLIEGQKPDALVDRGIPIGESVQAALGLLRKANLVLQQGDHLNAKYVIDSQNYLSTTYYANMAVHHLFHRAFIELALVKIAKVPAKKRVSVFWEEIMELRDLFKFEFFYSRKATFSDEIDENLKFIDPDFHQNVSKARTKTIKILEKQKVLVSPVVLNTYVEAYLVVAQALKNIDPLFLFDESEFINNCLFLGEESNGKEESKE